MCKVQESRRANFFLMPYDSLPLSISDTRQFQDRFQSAIRMVA
jgi:hypothetical protein